jgi:class 3 adenylate cyclase/predicted ATPase
MHRLVPDFILEQYAAGQVSGSFEAAGLFVDISGFSAITDALMSHGQHGSEVLAVVMRAIFDPLIQSVYEQDGFVVTFAGDAFTALFSLDSSPGAVQRRALAAAWHIQERMAALAEQATPYGTFSLAAKVGVAVGDVRWGIVSSDDGDRAAYYFQGPAIEEPVAAELVAGPGQVILTPDLYEAVRRLVTAEATAGHYRLTGVRGPLPGPQPVDLPPIDLDIADRFYPHGLATRPYSGEFRHAISLFINLPTVRTTTQLAIFMRSLFTLQDRYGGLLNRLDFGDKGSNLLLFWGAPVAYENDVERALNFILDLQTQTSIPINAGVAYRIAHAGFIGSPLREEYTCFGRGVNLAARFMTAAPRGEIWLDEATARRAETHFEVEFEEEMAFKGFAEGQRVYVLFERKEKVETFFEGKLVGREAELAQLAEFVAPLWEGRYAGAAVIWGDPGIGKSRLVHEFRTSPVFARADVLWALCQADEILRKSLNPFRYWLRRYFGQSEQQSDARNKRNFNRKLDGLLAATEDAHLASELDHTRSCLGALVNLRWPDSLYEQLDAPGRYENTFVALGALVRAESHQQPLLLIIEDAHWLDDDSRTFLPRLADTLAAERGHERYPVAILAAARPEGRGLPGGEALSGLEINLGGLSREALGDLALGQLDGPAGPPLLDLLEERAEGNPFFAEQILHYLQEEALLVRAEDGWRTRETNHRSPLPGDVRVVLVARLDRLVDEVKEAVQTAAVLGREFEVRLLARMLESAETFSAADTAAAEFAGDVSRLVAEAEQQAIWSALSELRYIFKHALLRDAAYRMQVRARRQALHSLAVDVLESVYAADLSPHYAELAYHAEQARLTDKAVRYLQLAGDAAARNYANTEAIAHFDRALTLLETLPPTAERDRQELALQIALFAPIAGTKGYGAPELGKAYTRAQELSERAGEPGQVFLVLYGLWGHNLVQGDMKIAGELATQCLALAQKIQERALLMEGHRMMDETALYSGEWIPARQHVERTLSLYDPQLHRAHVTAYGQDPGVASLSHGSWILWNLGYPDQARNMGQQALALGEESSHPFSLGFALCYVAGLHQFCRERQRVEELAEAAIRLSTEHGLVLWLTVTTALQGWALADRGQREEGIAKMRQGLADYQAIPQGLHQPYLMALLAEAYGGVGQPAEGLTLLDEALALVDQGELRYYEPELYRLKGELSLMGGQEEVAVEADFRQAIDIARRQSAKWLELRAATSLSRLWLKGGKPDKARQLLADVYNWFTEGFDTGDLLEAKALLDEMA